MKKIIDKGANTTYDCHGLEDDGMRKIIDRKATNNQESHQTPRRLPPQLTEKQQVRSR